MSLINRALSGVFNSLASCIHRSAVQANDFERKVYHAVQKYIAKHQGDRTDHRFDFDGEASHRASAEKPLNKLSALKQVIIGEDESETEQKISQLSILSEIAGSGLRGSFKRIFSPRALLAHKALIELKKQEEEAIMSAMISFSTPGLDDDEQKQAVQIFLKKLAGYPEAFKFFEKELKAIFETDQFAELLAEHATEKQVERFATSLILSGVADDTIVSFLKSVAAEEGNLGGVSKGLRKSVQECRQSQQFLQQQLANLPSDLVQQAYQDDEFLQANAMRGGFEILRKFCGKTLIFHLPQGVIKARPDAFLKELSDQVKGNHKLSKLLIKYRGQSGIDLGGLSRQFMTDLFFNLGLSKKPVIHSDAKAEILKQVGAVMGFILGSKELYRMGGIFDETVFKNMYLFSDADLQQDFSTVFAELKQSQLMLAIDHFTDSQEARESLHTYRKLLQAERFEDIKEQVEAIIEDEKLLMFESELEDKLDELTNSSDAEKLKVVQDYAREYLDEEIGPRLRAAFALAQGLRDALPRTFYPSGKTRSAVKVANFDDLKAAINFRELEERVQGKLNRELLAQNLNVKGDNDKARQLKEWLVEWVENPETPLEDLENFLMQVSGTTTVTKPVNFEFVNNQAAGVRIWACTYNVHINPGVLELGKDAFLAQLTGDDSMNAA